MSRADSSELSYNCIHPIRLEPYTGLPLMALVQNRFSRLITGATMPAVIFATFVVVLIAVGIRLPPIPASFGSLPGYLGLILSGWILGGAQSIIYSLLMEYVVNLRVENERFAISISGLLVSLIIWSVIPVGFPVVLLGIGFIVGCIVGYFLRDMYKYYA